MTRLILAYFTLATLLALPAHAESPKPIHNFLKVTENLYSGGEPQGEADFKQLAAQGITTIISVDGAKPNLLLAKKYGLRYIHIPIGYDTIDQHALDSMATVLNTYDTSLYIHCHHGKHRGPAMAAIAWSLKSDPTKEEVYQYLHKAGTSKNYKGLWESVKIFNAESISNPKVKLYETAPVAKLVEEMAIMDRISDRLKACKDAGWQSPEGHDDISPPHEAVMLAERFRELLRIKDHADMKDQLKQSEDLAWTLSDELQKKDFKAADTTFNSIKKRCTDCHKEKRN